LETVRGEGEFPSGVYFMEATPASLQAAIEDFERREREFTIEACYQNAISFSAENFKISFSALLAREVLPAGNFAGTQVADIIRANPGIREWGRPALKDASGREGQAVAHTRVTNA
jgi:hypothetical protein